MILSDQQIRQRINDGSIGFQITPGYTLDDHIGPASLDFRLGNSFKVYKRSKTTVIDPFDKQTVQDNVELITIPDGESFILHPRQFVLGVTAEKIKVPPDLVARCEGRSSLGRLGIIIHSTAGFLDPGFEGTITLEITNINEVPIKLYPGMRFGQYAFETIQGTVGIPYNVRESSKYMNQDIAQESRIDQDKEFQK